MSSSEASNPPSPTFYQQQGSFKRASENGCADEEAFYTRGGGGVASRAATVFRALDVNDRMSLEFETMMSGLAQFGMCAGLNYSQVCKILELPQGSMYKGRQFSLGEFTLFYDRLANYLAKSARQDRIQGQTQYGSHDIDAYELKNDKLLKCLFVNYCRYATGQGRLIFDEQDPKMSGTQFLKVCEDMGCISPVGTLSVVTIDLIFHRCKQQGKRRFQFPDFLKALCSLGESSGLQVFEAAYMLGAQIKPGQQHFIAPQAVDASRLFPSAAGATAQSAQKPRNARDLEIERIYSNKLKGPGKLCKSPKDDSYGNSMEDAASFGAPLKESDNNAGGEMVLPAEIGALLVDLKNQVQGLQAQNATLASEIQSLQQKQGQQWGAMSVALKSVGVDSVEAAGQPGMLPTAAAYHDTTLRSRLSVASLADRVASLEAHRSPSDLAHATRKPGIEAAVRTLTALSHSPLETSAGLAVAAAALAELAKPRSQRTASGAGARQGDPGDATAAATAAAVAAGDGTLVAQGIDPSDAKHRKGMEAAALALRALAARGGGPKTQAGGFAAAADALQAAGIDMKVNAAAHEPGFSGAVTALEAMASDLHAHTSHRPGFRQGAAVLGALLHNSAGGAGHGQGIAAAVAAVAALEASSSESSPGDKAGLGAAKLALETLLASSSAGGSPGGGKSGGQAPGPVATEAALAARGIDASGAAHKPGMDAAIAMLQDLANHGAGGHMDMAELQQRLAETQTGLAMALKALGLNPSSLQEGGQAESVVVHKSAMSDVLARLAALEREQDLMTSMGAKGTDLKELENYMLERLAQQDQASMQLRQSLIVLSEEAKAMGDDNASFDKIMEKMLERFALISSLREASKIARLNDEVILKAIKELDDKYQKRNELTAKVLIRTAQTVDYLHECVREQAERLDAVPGRTIMTPSRTEREQASGARPSVQDMAAIGLSSSMKALMADQAAAAAAASPAEPEGERRGFRHTMQDMSYIGRSSGMKALMADQAAGMETALDRALRSTQDASSVNGRALTPVHEGEPEADIGKSAVVAYKAQRTWKNNMALRQMAQPDAVGEDGEPRVYRGRAPDENKFAPLEVVSKRKAGSHRGSMDSPFVLAKPGAPFASPGPGSGSDVRLPLVAPSPRVPSPTPESPVPMPPVVLPSVQPGQKAK